MADLICGDGGSNGQAVIARINDNTARIQTNEDDISILNTSIDNIESLRRFVYDSKGLTANVPEVYTTLNTINVTLLPGVYVVNVSLIYTFEDVNDNVLFRLVTNGSVREMVHEQKDQSDVAPINYQFIHTQSTQGTFTLVLEARKENSTSGTLEILESSLYADKRAELP